MSLCVGHVSFDVLGITVEFWLYDLSGSANKLYKKCFENWIY